MIKLHAAILVAGSSLLLPALATTPSAQAQTTNATQMTNQLSPSADSAYYQEFNPNGIPLTAALTSVMPPAVAQNVADGDKVIGVSIKHMFFSVNNGIASPTSLSNWEQLSGDTQYNVITSSLINAGNDSSLSTSDSLNPDLSRNINARGPSILFHSDGVVGPGGGNGTSGMYDNNQLSLMTWITQNSTSSINYTFNGQALWSNYDTVTGNTDYLNLTWWPDESSQNSSATRSAIGVNVNDASETESFPTQLAVASANQYEITVPQSQYKNTVEYVLDQVDWGITVANADLSPNDLNAGDLDGYYTQTWTGVTPSFTIGYDTAALTVTGTPEENTWYLGPLNWSPDSTQTN